jgi:hypothetical protein
MTVLRVLAYFADDFSDLTTDELIFDVQPNVGEVFNRTLNFELFNAAGLTFDAAPGKYTANVKWEVS